MEFLKFAISVVAGSAVATAMLGGVIKVVQILQTRAAASKALVR